LYGVVWFSTVQRTPALIISLLAPYRVGCGGEAL